MGMNTLSITANISLLHVLCNIPVGVQSMDTSQHFKRKRPHILIIGCVLVPDTIM